MTPYFSMAMEPPPRLTPSLRSTFSTSSLTSRPTRSRVIVTPATSATPRNKLIAITKVKVIILYKACKCDGSIAIRVCGVAIL